MIKKAANGKTKAICYQLLAPQGQHEGEQVVMIAEQDGTVSSARIFTDDRNPFVQILSRAQAIKDYRELEQAGWVVNKAWAPAWADA